MATFRTVLVAVDFSETSQEALQVACGLARDASSTLHILHVVPDVRERFGAIERPGQTFHELQAEWLEQAAIRVSALASTHKGPVVCKAVVGARTAETIAHYADEQHADVLVVGTHGYGPVRRWLLGSVSERLVRIADRPVLTVPPRRARGEKAHAATDAEVPAR